MNVSELKTELIKQKNSKFKGNIYHYTDYSIFPS